MKLKSICIQINTINPKYLIFISTTKTTILLTSPLTGLASKKNCVPEATMAIKTKLERPDNNIGYKRRVMITNSDFDKLLKKQQNTLELANQSLEKNNDNQIAKEIDYMIQYFDLRPKVFVTYKRESYKDEANLRVTFDEKLKYRDTNLSLKKSKDDKIYFNDNRNIIMEIKADESLPLWLVQQMSKLKIYPQSFSKIGKVYQRIRKEQNV